MVRSLWQISRELLAAIRRKLHIIDFDKKQFKRILQRKNSLLEGKNNLVKREREREDNPFLLA